MPTIIKNGRNYSGTSVSLTQAEYDALPEVTKMNGTTYFITDSEVVLNAEDVALDEGNLNDLAGSVATIETSPATANHEVGEYILWNGVVYVVTSAIATGDNLVINSNISARTIGSELTALNNGLIAEEKTLISQTGQIQLTVQNCYKVGNIVVVSVYITVTSAITQGSFPLVKLPAISKKRFDVGAISTSGVCLLYCDRNSDILRFNAGNMSATGWIVNFAYAVAD